VRTDRTGVRLPHVTDSQIDQLVAAVRALPAAERLHVAKRVIDALDENDRRLVLKQAESATTPAPDQVPSMLGLFADEPDLVDEVCRIAYAARAAARLRTIDQ
jgi:hypothetical protein